MYTDDFCRSNSVQLQNRTCKPATISAGFSVSAIIAAISQEFRTCSKLDAILRRFLTKLNHKGPLGRFYHAGFQFVFVWLWLIQTKNLHSSMSSSSPITGNSISDTQTGSSNSKVFLNIHAYLPVHFPSG